jgi:hypothetical protein
MESPFTSHSPSGLSTPLQGFQHRLDRNSTCWDLRNSTAATQIHPATKCMLPWMNLNKTFTHRNNLFLHEIPAPNNFQTCPQQLLQASTLRTPLLARKLHVKITLYAKM